MSITDSEIMGGVGFGDEQYNFYDHAEDISRLINHGHRRTDSFDQMLSNEEISYVKGNPRIVPAYQVYGAPGSPGPVVGPPEELDNGDTVEKYLLNRIPTANMPKSAPMARKYDKDYPLKIGKEAKEGFVGGAIEKLEDSVNSVLGPHTVSMLVTFIFILVVAIVVMQILHTQKIYKIMKKMVKRMAQPMLVAVPAESTKQT